MELSQALRAVHDVIDAERDYVVRLTRDMVRIPSVNPKFETGEGLNREADVQSLLASHLEPLGLTLERWDVFPGRPNLVGALAGNQERSLLLNGHIDVVPTGDRSKWSVDPFGGEIRDGRLWGRGAIDMKCGVAASLAAIRAILKAGFHPDGRIDFHSVVDEEAGGFGSMDAARRCPRATAGIVTEPTWGKVMPAEGGLEWVRVTIPGKTAHSAWRYNSIYPQKNEPGRLEPGVNAVDYAARFIEQLRELERDWATTKYHPLLPPGVNSLHVGAVVAGASPGPDGRPTILSNPAITPDCAAIDIDLKFLPHETKEQVRADFESFVHNWAQQYSWLRSHPPQIRWDLSGLAFPTPQYSHRSFPGAKPGSRPETTRQRDRNCRIRRRLRCSALRRRWRPLRHLWVLRRRFPRRRRICRDREPRRDGQTHRGRHHRLVWRRASLSAPESSFSRGQQ